LTVILPVWSGHFCPLAFDSVFILTFGFEFDLDYDLDLDSAREGHGFKSLP
jgi:hypothetical protein